MASGLVIILLNKATRLSDDLMGLSKEYIASIRFGIETDTMDVDGNITRSRQMGELDRKKVKKILERFTGNLEQIPPMYSALKQGGQPLYKLARKGVAVARKTRNISIYGIEVLDWFKDRVTVKIACSSGTYIRVLANDIGKAYGTGAVLSGLRRTKIGHMGVDGAAGIDSIKGLTDRIGDFKSSKWVISLEELLVDSSNLYVSNKYEEQVKNGSLLSREMLAEVLLRPDISKEYKRLPEDIAAVRTRGGKLLAVHRILTRYDKINTLSMNKVFTKSVLIL
jgi:tRNA pseudouridine(55) synthase